MTDNAVAAAGGSVVAVASLGCDNGEGIAGVEVALVVVVAVAELRHYDAGGDAGGGDAAALVEAAAIGGRLAKRAARCSLGVSIESVVTVGSAAETGATRGLAGVAVAENCWPPGWLADRKYVADLAAASEQSGCCCCCAPGDRGPAGRTAAGSRRQTVAADLARSRYTPSEQLER